MTTEELTATLTLLEIPKLSRRDVGRLVVQTGSATAVLSTPEETLRSWGLSRESIRAIKTSSVSDDTKKHLEFIEKHSIRTIGYMDAGYPPLLHMCDDAPVMLFGRGNADIATSAPVIAVVGTRGITPYGVSAVNDIIAGLAPYRPLIVSGLAAGVDVHAHRAAMKNSLPTVGILGQGLGTPLYPADNRETASQMCSTDGCGVFSEYNHLMAAMPGLFPMRNRIVAGMAMATIVVEAKAKGGALITATLAAGYNRDVFAVPGRITDPCSAGCNALIRANRAIILDSVDTVIDELSLAVSQNEKKTDTYAQTVLFSDLSDDQKPIVDALLPHEKMHIDELCAELNVPPYKIAGTLLDMELKGFIMSLPGKYYAVAPSMRA
ncbi:MAG: DNA-protecting protein DprA [Flavobacteriales bacterium]|nr:DNA-protecting protein DprA [Flavobacteriales bacterium]